MLEFLNFGQKYKVHYTLSLDRLLAGVLVLPCSESEGFSSVLFIEPTRLFHISLNYSLYQNFNAFSPP